MKKIELYKRVILTQDYKIKDIDNHIIIFKKGLTGVAIDYGRNENMIMVEISEDEGYEDTLPCFPVELLEYFNSNNKHSL